MGIRRNRTLHRAFALLAGAALSLTTLTACGSGDDAATGSVSDKLAGASFVIGSKDFTENIVLGQIAVHLFRAHGAEITDKTNLGGTVSNRKALEAGEIDMYWDYSGTGWIEFLKNSDPIPDPAEQFEATAKADLEKNGIRWIGPTPLNNTYALAIRSEKAAELGVKTLSDVAKLAETKPQEVTLCIETEFSTRNDGLPGMVKHYDMEIPDNQVSVLDTGVVYTETDKGETCNFGEVFATDGRIAALGLTVLEDDKKFFPIYNAALTLKEDTFKQYPAIEEVLQPVIEKLDDTTMSKMNARVDVDGEEPSTVAREWLEEAGFLGGDSGA
ncbi:glycine betaine ABC transporter substrate-binding protein [Thermostaphylospora chromogena]|uniref:Osmoprotectant transport system substrate-binding protein n=1 Tax=Thermostaphylospora chromogena TaxID=35622 RepID=A0A1H1DEZ2_9ACTN|nr:glycine betaine ABC transporter substrate-binding protein [Thermostaphylospora chromogena]SDQ75032.1 osmoprotectant transport system substrate-binding protein [Thermostaphylospora chromogena]